MKAIEAAHRKAVEAAEASSRASGGQPYDGYPAPAYEVYRDALFAALAEDDAAVERIKEAIESECRTVIDQREDVTISVGIRSDLADKAARAAIRAMGE